MGCCESRQKNPFLEEELKKGIKNIENKQVSQNGQNKKSITQYKSMSMNKTFMSRNDKMQIQKYFSSSVNQKEVTELNNAFSNEDIDTIISYLSSDIKLKNELTIPHDWAPPLSTVGTLATELLAEMFEDEDNDLQSNEQLAEKISQKKRGLKNKLMQTDVQIYITNNLQSLMKDRREWTLILILILIDGDEVMQEYFIKNQLMNFVIPFLQPFNHKDLKILAFDVLKELYAERVELAVQFLQSSGAEYFKNFFTENQLEMIFVGVYGLILLTEDEKLQEKNQEIAQILIDQGFKQILINLQSELNFIDPGEDVQIQNKRKYCITAVKRVLQFLQDNSQKI